MLGNDSRIKYLKYRNSEKKQQPTKHLQNIKCPIVKNVFLSQTYVICYMCDFKQSQKWWFYYTFLMKLTHARVIVYKIVHKYSLYYLLICIWPVKYYIVHVYNVQNNTTANKMLKCLDFDCKDIISIKSLCTLVFALFCLFGVFVV